VCSSQSNSHTSDSDPALLRRKAPRYPLAATVDVLTMRSGISANIPGRMINIGESGLSAILAGQFSAGQGVSLSFRLPSVGRAVHTEAVIRHANGLQYGLEFVNSPREQQEMIRYWAAGIQSRKEIHPKKPPLSFGKQGLRTRFEQLKRPLALALLLLVTTGCFALLRWQRGWRELKAEVPAASFDSAAPEVRIPGETMQKLLTHKVEPALSLAPQSGPLRGTVTLDAVIGKDGGVRDVHAVSGPEPLAEAALDAVRGWRFEPYRIRGKAVAVETTLTVDFGPIS
jgi:TonB family protein